GYGVASPIREARSERRASTIMADGAPTGHFTMSPTSATSVRLAPGPSTNQPAGPAEAPEAGGKARRTPAGLPRSSFKARSAPRGGDLHEDPRGMKGDAGGSDPGELRLGGGVQRGQDESDARAVEIGIQKRTARRP